MLKFDENARFLLQEYTTIIEVGSIIIWKKAN